MSYNEEKLMNVPKYSLFNREDIVLLSKELKKHILKNSLSVKIKGKDGTVKDFVCCEGWQFAGASLGLIPVLISTEKVKSDNDELKYESIVEIRDSNGNVMGRGYAICSNKEYKKDNYDEYAIASISQTRAVGKAFRLLIGWVIKMAGYETTPSEEMPALEKEHSFSLTNKQFETICEMLNDSILDREYVSKVFTAIVKNQITPLNFQKSIEKIAKDIYERKCQIEDETSKRDF